MIHMSREIRLAAFESEMDAARLQDNLRERLARSRVDLRAKIRENPDKVDDHLRAMVELRRNKMVVIERRRERARDLHERADAEQPIRATMRRTLPASVFRLLFIWW